jgi:hypothetical protein
MDWNLPSQGCSYRYFARSIFGCDSLFSNPSDTAGLLGLNENNLSQEEKVSWKIYPNPASSKVYFEGSKMEPLEITLYNNQGKAVFRKDFGVVQQGEISVEEWPSGTYFAKFWVKKNGQRWKENEIKLSIY